MSNAKRDQNHIPTLLGVSNVDGITPITVYADPVTHRLLVDNSGASSGITSINADTTAAQTLAVGTSGTDFAIADNGTGTHTFNLPDASATARGVVTTGAQTIAGAKTFSSTIVGSINGNAATVTVADAGGDTTTWPLLGTSQTGSLTPASDGGLTYNATTHALTATTFVGSLSGNATSATTATTATTVTTNANLTGPITSVGNATSIASQTGTGTKFVVDTTPTLVTPVLGVATATSINKVALTAPATSATLTIADGKTATHNASTTFTGTDGKTLTVSDSTTLATNSITLGGGEVVTFSASNALSLLTTGTSVMTFPTATDTVVTLAATQTLTNKRITPRILSAASYTTDTGSSINGDTQDMFIVTAQTGAIKFNNPTGTPTDGQKFIISVASSTTAARAITWDTAYGSTTVSLPSTTAATTVTLTIGFIWSASKSLWQCVAVA